MKKWARFMIGFCVANFVAAAVLGHWIAFSPSLLCGVLAWIIHKQEQELAARAIESAVLRAQEGKA